MRKNPIYIAVLPNYTGNESGVDIHEYEEGTCIDEAHSTHVIHEYGSYIDSGEDIIHEYEWENDCQENDSQEHVRNDCRQVPAKQAAIATKGMASTLNSVYN